MDSSVIVIVAVTLRLLSTTLVTTSVLDLTLETCAGVVVCVVFQDLGVEGVAVELHWFGVLCEYCSRSGEKVGVSSHLAHPLQNFVDSVGFALHGSLTELLGVQSLRGEL